MVNSGLSYLPVLVTLLGALGTLDHFLSWINGYNSSMKHRFSPWASFWLIFCYFDTVGSSLWVNQQKPMEPKKSKLVVSTAGSAHWANVMKLGSTSEFEGSQIPPLDSWTSCPHPRILEVLYDSLCLSIKKLLSHGCPPHSESIPDLSICPWPLCHTAVNFHGWASECKRNDVSRHKQAGSFSCSRCPWTVYKPSVSH